MNRKHPLEPLLTCIAVLAVIMTFLFLEGCTVIHSSDPEWEYPGSFVVKEA